MNMIKRLIAFSLFLLPLPLAAQSTTVSTTAVTDTDGFTWSNGTYTITFVPNSSWPSPQSYTWSGGTLNTASPITGSLNSSAAFSASVPSNTAITPAGSQWKFTICPNASSGCFAVNLTVTGTTQDITAALNAAAQGPRFTIPYNVGYGYGAVEAISPSIGAIFYDTTNSICMQWSGLNWLPCGGSINGSGSLGIIPYWTSTYTLGATTLLWSGGNSTLQTEDNVSSLGGPTNRFLALYTSNAYLNGLNNTVMIPSCTGTDDTTAIDTAWSAVSGGAIAQTLVFPSHQTCVYAGTSPLTIKPGVRYDLNGSKIQFTGSGGGACSINTNGLLQYSGNGYMDAILENGTLESDNSSTGCILNIGASGFGGQRFIPRNLSFQTTNSNTTAAIYMSNTGNVYVRDNIFGSGFTYDINSPDNGAQNNGIEISGNNLGALGNTTNAQVNLVNFQSIAIKNNVFETGPYGIKVTAVSGGGSGGLDIESNWFGDDTSSGTQIRVQGGSSCRIANNWIQTTGSSSIGIFVQNQCVVEGNYIYQSGTCISTNGGNSATIIGNECEQFVTTGILLGSSTINNIVRNNILNGLNANTIGVDTYATSTIIGPNSYYLPGSGSTTVECESGSQSILFDESTPSDCVKNTNNVRLYSSTGTTSTIPKLLVQTTMAAASYAGTGTATFALGSTSHVGTGATVICQTGHVCDSASGTLLLTTGTGTLSAGDVVTVTLPVTRTNYVNCGTSGGVLYAHNFTASTLTLASTSALTASTAYQIAYWCGGN
jgi:hypothetical protein